MPTRTRWVGTRSPPRRSSSKGLGCLPRHLVVYGIEAEDLDVGVGLSPAVARGVEEATERVAAELTDGRIVPSPPSPGGPLHA